MAIESSFLLYHFKILRMHSLRTKFSGMDLSTRTSY